MTAKYRRYLLGSIAVMAFLAWRSRATSPDWNRSDSSASGAALRVPAGRNLHLFRARNRNHDCLRNPRVDSPLHWQGRSLVPLGNRECDRSPSALFIASLPLGPSGIASARGCLSFWILTVPAMWYAGKPSRLASVRFWTWCGDIRVAALAALELRQTGLSPMGISGRERNRG